MKVYLGIKYYEDNSNQKLIDGISKRLESLGHNVFCVARDLEKWGNNSFSAKELMEMTFKEINSSDIVLIEFSEKGVGLGIEAGYAYSKKIPVHVISKKEGQISNTLKGIASKISYYESYLDLVL